MKLKVSFSVYDKSITFLFECDDDEVSVLQKFCNKVNEKMADAYYFDQVKVEEVKDASRN